MKNWILNQLAKWVCSQVDNRIPPQKTARELGVKANAILDQWGEPSNTIQKRFANYSAEFVNAFNKELLKDTK